MGKIAQRVFRYSLHILDLSNQLKEEQSQRELEHLQLTHWANAMKTTTTVILIKMTGTAVLLVKMTKF